MTSPELPARFYNPYAFEFDTETVIALLADRHIRQAIERGEFDDLPGSGRPLDLPAQHDPDWWLKGLIKREGLALLPASIQLRKDDAALDDLLDRLPHEDAVRREVRQFNERVVRARYLPPAGPPLITMPRDVDATVTAWTARREARAEEARRQSSEHTSGTLPPQRRRRRPARWRRRG
ncbi:DUF1992 domain-containing protein [Propioniciclava coleopterorum]|uniref:DUF1992 domain-containing protein n=1 Tax=Propioniciclava coleopterorum TaxID=2714937 RepID=A0A6G7Y4R5_9ACTN|nr:DUF1992 domain-containing protein [Propioniciclava coleopterorum]QIK71656.1 DUF1992 domain-containing protein [Propioniciclava coleopterorum]